MTGGLVDAAAALLPRPADAGAAAPGRVNLIGEHTDYNDGFVLPFAIDQRTVCLAAARTDDVVTVRSTAQPDRATFTLDTSPGDVTGWAAYVAGTVWALREAGLDLAHGYDLAVASDVWLGAGLSSSAALESAVALALGGDDLPVGAADDRAGLAAVAQRAENVYVGAPTGILDQSASLRCRADHALLLDCRSGDVEHVPLPLEARGLTVLVIDSGVSHEHAGGEYADRRTACEAAAAALGVAALRDATPGAVDAAALDPVQRRRARHVTTENERVLELVDLLRADAPASAFGPVLTASHASMRDDFEITVPEVDLLVDTALAAGAHGARMTGGGFGGCVLALVDESDAAAVAAAVERDAAAAGHPTPRVVPQRPAAGGRVLTP